MSHGANLKAYFINSRPENKTCDDVGVLLDGNLLGIRGYRGICNKLNKYIICVFTEEEKNP